jgi:hypothetical protein
LERKRKAARAAGRENRETERVLTRESPREKGSYLEPKTQRMGIRWGREQALAR